MNQTPTLSQSKTCWKESQNDCCHYDNFLYNVPGPFERQSLYRVSAKEIVERRHGEPINSYFCLKWAFWAARSVMKKIAGCELWATFEFFFFSCFHGQKLNFLKFVLHCRVCTKKLFDKKVIFFCFNLGSIFFWVKNCIF